MKFSFNEIVSFMKLAELQTEVEVTGANYLGQEFKTKGIILHGRDSKGNIVQINENLICLFLGQYDERNEQKKKFVVLTSSFRSSKAMCIDKIVDRDGRVLYQNEKYRQMFDDRRWELAKFYGYSEEKRDENLDLHRFIGRPVRIHGEALSVMAIGEKKENLGKVFVSCTDGYNQKMFEVYPYEIKFDDSISLLPNKRKASCCLPSEN